MSKFSTQTRLINGFFNIQYGWWNKVAAIFSPFGAFLENLFIKNFSRKMLNWRLVGKMLKLLEFLRSPCNRFSENHPQCPTPINFFLTTATRLLQAFLLIWIFDFSIIMFTKLILYRNFMASEVLLAIAWADIYDLTKTAKNFTVPSRGSIHTHNNCSGPYAMKPDFDKLINVLKCASDQSISIWSLPGVQACGLQKFTLKQ